MPSNTTIIIVGVLFYHGYMFRRLIGPSSGYSEGLHCYYQSIYIFIVTITLEAYTVTSSINLSTFSLYYTVIRDLLFHLYSFGFLVFLGC
jgi:hypothetical protein